MENTLTLAGCVIALVIVCWMFAEGINIFGRWIWRVTK